MINVIHLPSLHNAEFIQYNRDVLQIVQLNNPATLLVQPQFTALTALVANIETLFVTDQGNPITAVLLALDERRDKAINGIGAVINGYTYHYDAPKAAAANLLQHNLGLYGTGIARLNYLAETTTITNLVNDWESVIELATAVAELQLEDWLAELKTANLLFNNQYILRTQQLGAANPDTIRALRQEASDMYYFLRNFIDFYFASNNGIDPWGKTTNELNALIDQYNVLLAGRANEPLPPAPPPQPEPTPVPPPQQ